MSELEKDFIIEEPEAIEEQTVDQTDFVSQTIPISKMMVGMAEMIIGTMVKDEAQRMKILQSYEQSTLSVLDVIHFDEAFTRVVGSGKPMDDKTVLIFGSIYFVTTTVTTIFMVRPPKWLRKLTGGEENARKEQQREDNTAERESND